MHGMIANSVTLLLTQSQKGLKRKFVTPDSQSYHLEAPPGCHLRRLPL